MPDWLIPKDWWLPIGVAGLIAAFFVVYTSWITWRDIIRGADDPLDDE